MTPDQTARVRALNDDLRHNPNLGQVMITQGISAEGVQFIARVWGLITRFDNFSADDDPYPAGPPALSAHA